MSARVMAAVAGDDHAQSVGVLGRLDEWLANIDYGSKGSELRDSIAKFVTVEREQHADEFEVFMDKLAVTWMTSRAATVLSRRRHTARRSVFRRSVQDVEKAGGSPAEAVACAAGLLADAMVVAEGNIRKRVADMTGPDHLYVAGRYDHTVKQARLLTQFHLAVARKVEGRRTGDVFTDESYAALYRSIVGRPHPAASQAR